MTSTTVVTSAEIDDGNPKTRELQTRADIEIEILVRHTASINITKAGRCTMINPFFFFFFFGLNKNQDDIYAPNTKRD